MTAQFFANVGVILSVMLAAGIIATCQCNRIQWSERRV